MGAGVAAAVGQRLNLAGVALASRVAVSQRHLALPHVTVRDIRCVDWAALRARGFQGVVLDKDNTITAPYAMAVWPGLVGALEECKAAFPGAVALLSNSAGAWVRGCVRAVDGGRDGRTDGETDMTD